MGIILCPFRDAEADLAIRADGAAGVRLFGVKRVAVPHEEQPQAIVRSRVGQAGRVLPREEPAIVGFLRQCQVVRQGQQVRCGLQLREVTNQPLVIERGEVCFQQEVVPVGNHPLGSALPVGIDAHLLQGLVEDGDGRHPLLLGYLPRRCGRLRPTRFAPEAGLTSPFIDDVIAYLSGEVPEIIITFHK